MPLKPEHKQLLREAIQSGQYKPCADWFQDGNGAFDALGLLAHLTGHKDPINEGWLGPGLNGCNYNEFARSVGLVTNKHVDEHRFFFCATLSGTWELLLDYLTPEVQVGHPRPEPSG